MIEAFIHGAILAFGLILPLGAQNIFVFNQGASQHPFRFALPSILTAFLCDTILIALAVLGVALIILQLTWLKSIVLGIGIIFLLYMGWITWHSEPHLSAKKPKPLSPKKQIAFAISISLLNPHAIIDTIGVIGTNSLRYLGTDKLAYTIACILVSLVWFLSLAIAGHKLHKLDQKGIWLRMLNKISAIIMWLVALYIGLQFINA